SCPGGPNSRRARDWCAEKGFLFFEPQPLTRQGRNRVGRLPTIFVPRLRGPGGIVNQTQIEIGGRTLTVETGPVAQQASGAVTIRMGDNMLLVTAVMSAHPRA